MCRKKCDSPVDKQKGETRDPKRRERYIARRCPLRSQTQRDNLLTSYWQHPVLNPLATVATKSHAVF